MEFEPLLTAIKICCLFYPGREQHSCPKRLFDAAVTFVYLCFYLLLLASLASKATQPYAGEEDVIFLRVIAAFMLALQIFSIRTFFSSYSTEILQLIDRFDGIDEIFLDIFRHF